MPFLAYCKTQQDEDKLKAEVQKYYLSLTCERTSGQYREWFSSCNVSKTTDSGHDTQRYDMVKAWANDDKNDGIRVVDPSDGISKSKLPPSQPSQPGQSQTWKSNEGGVVKFQTGIFR